MPYTIRWTREKGQLPARASVKSGVLTIVDVRLDDNGTYVCQADATEATPQLTSSQEKAAIIVEGLELKYAPRVRVEPRYVIASLSFASRGTDRCKSREREFS